MRPASLSACNSQIKQYTTSNHIYPFVIKPVSMLGAIVGTRWDCGSAGINKAIQVQSMKTNY